MFRFKKLVKKRLGMQEKVAMECVDREKAYSTRSREKVFNNRDKWECHK